jgi:hypothetical protein
MHSDIKRGMAMLGAVTQLENHPKIPSNARAAVLFAEVREAFLEIQAMGGTQDSSRSQFLSGSDQRQQVANAIRLLMRQIARVAKVLKRSEYPGAREKLQVPRSNGYSALLTRASLYLETLPSIKSAFIERGMPADFDVRLRALIDDLKEATKRKQIALANQVGSTAGMRARLREAVQAVRELDVIMSLLLVDDPAMYAGWKSTSHIERAPRRNQKGAPESTAMTEESGSDDSSAVSLSNDVAADQSLLWSGDSPPDAPQT